MTLLVYKLSFPLPDHFIFSSIPLFVFLASIEGDFQDFIVGLSHSSYALHLYLFPIFFYRFLLIFMVSLCGVTPYKMLCYLTLINIVQGFYISSWIDKSKTINTMNKKIPKGRCPPLLHELIGQLNPHKFNGELDPRNPKRNTTRLILVSHNSFVLLGNFRFP